MNQSLKIKKHCFRFYIHPSIRKQTALRQAGLTPRERAKIVQEYERGRAHLLCSFTIKLAAYQTPPRLLLAGAHHNEDKAKSALARCLQHEGDCAHPAMLRVIELKDDALEWIEGRAVMPDLPELETFVASLKFGYAVERLVEGDHASIHRAYGRSRNHTEAYDSLTRRMKEIKQLVSTRQGLQRMTSFLARARNPRQASESLGFAQHPAINDDDGDGDAAARHAWDPIYRRIVYRADPHSLYHCELPDIQVGGQPPGGPLVAADEVDEGEMGHGTGVAEAGPVGEHNGGIEPRGALPDTSGGRTVTTAGDRAGSLTADTAVLQIKKHHALRLLSQRLSQYAAGSMFSMQICSGDILQALRSLHSVLAGSGGACDAKGSIAPPPAFDVGQPPAHGLQPVEAAPSCCGQLWFTIVAPDPSRAKRIDRGGLQSSDVALAPHALFWVAMDADAVEATGAVVSISPHTVQGPYASAAERMAACSLLLSTHLLQLPELSSIRRWDVMHDLIHFFIPGCFCCRRCCCCCRRCRRCCAYLFCLHAYLHACLLTCKHACLYAHCSCSYCPCSCSLSLQHACFLTLSLQAKGSQPLRQNCSAMSAALWLKWAMTLVVAGRHSPQRRLQC